jgi:hypothetical protein
VGWYGCAGEPGAGAAELDADERVQRIVWAGGREREGGEW